MNLSKTWKDEAIAFLIFIAALAFASREFRFYLDTQNEKPVVLREHQAPRPPKEDDFPKMAAGTNWVPPMPIVYGSGMIVGMSFGTASSAVYYYMDGESPERGVTVIRR